MGTVFLDQDLRDTNTNPFDVRPGQGSRSRKKPTKGHVAVRHAYAILAGDFPGQPYVTASKKIIWLPGNECPACKRGRTPVSMGEDIWGVFDVVMPGIGVQGLFLQITTETDSRSSVSQRKRKIEHWIEEELNLQIEAHTGEIAVVMSLFPAIEIWAWSRKRHVMRRWRYDAQLWRELSERDSPLLKRSYAESKVRS